jgi:hypothetical protein
MCPKTVNDLPERDTPCSRQRFAAVWWSRHKLHESSNYQWWIFGLWVDPETKIRSLQWKTMCSLRPKRHAKFGARRQWCWQFSSITKASFIISRHQKNKLLTTVLHRSSPLAAWCNAAQATCVVWGDWQLQHNNALAHSYHLVQNCLPKHQIPEVPQPPISPDMTLSGFFIFPKVKCYWRGIGCKTWRR